MIKMAEELQYDAKCQVAIGDEDPKDANPQFSIKAFREHMKAKKEKEEAKANSRVNVISPANKQKKRKDFGGVKVDH